MKLHYVSKKEREQRNRRMPLAGRQAGMDDAGFITSQTRFPNLYYGILGTRTGGCGPIACYNVLHALGKPADLADAVAYMEKNLLNGSIGGTMVFSLANYLRTQGVTCRTVPATHRLPAAAETADALVVMYHGISKKNHLPYAHFVAFIPQYGEDGAPLRNPAGQRLWRLYNAAQVATPAGLFMGNGVMSYEQYLKGFSPTFVIAAQR